MLLTVISFISAVIFILHTIVLNYLISLAKNFPKCPPTSYLFTNLSFGLEDGEKCCNAKLLIPNPKSPMITPSCDHGLTNHITFNPSQSYLSLKSSFNIHTHASSVSYFITHCTSLVTRYNTAYYSYFMPFSFWVYLTYLHVKVVLLTCSSSIYVIYSR